MQDLLDWVDKHDKKFPKLKFHLERFNAIVGIQDLKNTVAQQLKYIISQQQIEKMQLRKRKSTVLKKRKRKNHKWTHKKQRTEHNEEEEMLSGIDFLKNIMQNIKEEEDDEDEGADEQDLCLPSDGDGLKMISTVLGKLFANILDDGDEENEKVKTIRPDTLKDMNLHTLLLGPSGTDKVVIAKHLYNIWVCLGMVLPNSFVSITRSELVGHMARNTNKIHQLLNENNHGVIHIDESYSVYSESHHIHAKETLAEIVEYVTRNKKEVVLILSTNNDSYVVDSIIGLKSRFANILEIKAPKTMDVTKYFLKSIRKEGWKTNVSNLNLYDINLGTDIKKFIHLCKISCINRNWPNNNIKCITRDDIKVALKQYKQGFGLLQNHQALFL